MCAYTYRGIVTKLKQIIDLGNIHHAIIRIYVNIAIGNQIC